jgi:hypothetical protein
MRAQRLVQTGEVIDQWTIASPYELQLCPAHRGPPQNMLVVVSRGIQAYEPRDRSDRVLVGSLLALEPLDSIRLDLSLPSMPSLSEQHSILHT